MVRHTTAYFLFILYSIAMFGQLTPVISDFLSHHFAKAIHIATVHARYGSNHLDKELETATKKNNKNQGTTIHVETFDVHVISKEFNYYAARILDSDHFPAFRKLNIDAVFISKHSPPPRVS